MGTFQRAVAPARPAGWGRAVARLAVILYRVSTAGIPSIVLASGSPRRSQLLAGLGLAFTVVVPEVDETPEPGEAPAALVERLARSKALAVATDRSDALVIAADTTVAVDGVILNKPADEAENRTFVRRLAGREHDVFTGHALAYRGELETVVVHSAVVFRPLSDGEIARYCATGEGLDKAGGYAIQGRGAALIEGLRGCYPNVMGLSLVNVVLAARRLGVELV